MSDFVWFLLFCIAMGIVPIAVVSCAEDSRNMRIADCVRAGGQPQACREAMK